MMSQHDTDEGEFQAWMSEALAMAWKSRNQIFYISLETSILKPYPSFHWMHYHPPPPPQMVNNQDNNVNSYSSLSHLTPLHLMHLYVMHQNFQ